MSMAITAKNESIRVDDKADEVDDTNHTEAVIDDDLMDRLENLINHFEYAVKQHAELLKLFAKVQLISTDSTNRSPPNRKYRIPRKGVWRDFLKDVAKNMRSSIFTSNDFPRSQRHMLSLLCNQYGVLTVINTMGRTKIYQVDPEVLEILTKATCYADSSDTDSNIAKRVEKT